MQNRRVFVIWINPLFNESVHMLLNHPSIDWLGATADYASAGEQLANLQPDTILIEEQEDGTVPASVLGILETCPPEVRVFRMSLSGNELSVYHRERQTIEHAEDLLQLILAR